ncbi:MAG: FHA domain-containing protein [Limisphaerales bacterium]
MGVVEINQWPFVIGRNPSAQLSLELPGVWENHLTLNPREDGKVTAICSQETQVWLNDTTFQGQATLKPGDLITMGSFRWRLELQAAPARSGKVTESMFYGLLLLALLSQFMLIYRLVSMD